MVTESNKRTETAQRKFLWAVLFFLPALFFQSSLFAFISPLPFFIASLKDRIWIAIGSLISNAALIFWAEKDLSTTLLATWFWLNIGIVFPLFIRKTKRVPTAFFYSFSLCMGTLLLGLTLLAQQQGVEVIEYARQQIGLAIEHLLTIPEHPVKTWVQEQGKQELIRNIMVELPSGIMIGIILCYWFNLLLAFRTIPGFLSNAFWGSYKNPEWLVWPTILCGILYLLSDQAPYYIGLNGLKVLLLIYGFQGLSVVTYILNRKQVYGFFRVLIYGLIIFVASPIAFTVGFFDLWFDFRRKFGQF